MDLSPAQLKCLEEIFQADPRLLLVYLFGSRAQKTSTQQSDYDLAFLTQLPLSLNDRADLNVKVMKALGSDRVDFTFLAEAPILLKYEIISQGRSLYSRLGINQVNDLELSIYREYFHTERFRRLQRQQLRETFL